VSPTPAKAPFPIPALRLVHVVTRCVAAASVIHGLTSVAHGDDKMPLELTHVIPLAGVEGRLDHFACDVAAGRLFVAALENNSLEVVDVKRCDRVGSILGLHKPAGVLFVRGLQLIQVANGDDGSLRGYRADTFALSARLDGFEDADNMRFDPAENLVYVGYGNGALAVVDSSLERRIARIELPGHPEGFQVEELGRRIFVNVPDADEITVVDREQHRVVAHWPMAKFASSFPMALDEGTHRLFVGSRNPPRLVVLDTDMGTVVTDIPICNDTDDLFYDPMRHRLYISCGEGFVETVQIRRGDRYVRLARTPTRAGARTSYFVPELDRLFLAVPKREGQVAEVRIYRPR